jgi:hypothetical protein
MTNTMTAQLLAPADVAAQLGTHPHVVSDVLDLFDLWHEAQDGSAALDPADLATARERLTQLRSELAADANEPWAAWAIALDADPTSEP